MDTHGVPAGRTGFSFRQLIDVELLGLRVIVQPPAIGAAIYEPKLVVRSGYNGVQTIGFRLAGGRSNLGVA